MPPDDSLAAAFANELAPAGNGKAIDEADWDRRLRAAVEAGHVRDDGFSLADDLRHWATFVQALDPVEREVRISERLAVMSTLHENAQEMLREALAEAERERRAAAAGRPEGPRIVTAAQLAEVAPERPHYVLWGYLARGCITQLAAKMKLGKSRFVMDAVSKIVHGADFLGHMTEKTSVLYLTEEGAVTFRRGLERYDLTECETLHVFLRREAIGMSWAAVGDFVLEYITTNCIGLVVVDTLTDWAGITGDKENDAGVALEAMRPLRLWADAGASVLAVRHEGKQGGDVGDAARGSTAFGGAMDILCALRRPSGTQNPYQRELKAVGRFDDTPQDVVVELLGGLEEGRYEMVGETHQTQRLAAERAVIDLLPDHMDERVDEAYLVEASGMSRSTVKRTLDRLRTGGALATGKAPKLNGSGVRNVYWIGESDE